MTWKRRMTTLECLINKMPTGNKRCVAENSARRTSWIRWLTTCCRRWRTGRGSRKKCSRSIITREKWGSVSSRRRGRSACDRNKRKCVCSSPSRSKRKRSARTMRSRTSTCRPGCGRPTRAIGKRRTDDLSRGFSRLTKITRTTYWSKWLTKMPRTNSRGARWTNMTSWWISHC